MKKGSLLWNTMYITTWQSINQRRCTGGLPLPEISACQNYKNFFLSGKPSFKIQHSWLQSSILWEFVGKIKIFSTIINYVGNKQLSVGKMQLILAPTPKLFNIRRRCNQSNWINQSEHFKWYCSISTMPTMTIN